MRHMLDLPLVLALLASSCSIVPPAPLPSSCSGEERYLPAGTFPKDYPGSDQARRQWYSTVLARLDEPSLSCSEQSVQTYRLMWLHSFVQPVVIRVTRRGTEASLDAFQLSGIGAGDPGVLAYHVHKQLSPEDWGRIEAAIARSRFWSLPTSGNMYGAHGEQWIAEGRVAGAYHVVDRWTPPAGAYRDLGVLFFDLAGWQRPFSSYY